MSKVKLYIETEQEERQDISSDKNELVKSIYEEIKGYSLTPVNIKERELKIFKADQKLNIPKVQYEINKILLDNADKLSTVIHSKQSEQKLLESMMNLIQDSFSKELYISTRQQAYIEDYNRMSNIDVSEIPYSFRDQYEGVIRYGINQHNTIKIVENFNDILQNNIINIYHGQLENIDSKAVDKSSTKGSQKSANNANKLALDDNSFKILHPLEALILKDSIMDINSTRQKATLVDIFERNKDGSISTEKVQVDTEGVQVSSDISKPKTHTIILCRKGASLNEFLVIDPNNSEFSKHLGMTGVNNVISSLSGIEQAIKIEVSSIPYKIYEQRKDVGTGYGFNKFRDCIDIAFKLTKKINESPDENISFETKEKSPTIFANSIYNKIIEQVTNSKRLDNNIDKRLCKTDFLDYPFRGKQLTDENLSEKLYQMQTELYKLLFSKIDRIEDTAIITAIDKEIPKLLYSKMLDGEALSSFIGKIAKTISKQDEMRGLWDISQINSADDINVVELSGKLNEQFKSYYNQE